MLIILVLGASYLFMREFNRSSSQTERNRITAAALAEAKEALIAYAVSRTGPNQRPGDLVLPDYFASTETPPDYDGQSDGGCLDVSKPTGLPLINPPTTIMARSNMRCLGRLPWRTLRMSVPSPTENDTAGVIPWYAVSVNLTDPECLAKLNPLVLSAAYVGYGCGSVTLPHPWLTVRDANGNVVSSRVAAIILVPGPPLAGQSRPSLPLGSVDQYLDSVTIPAACTAPCVPGTYSNADLDNDFIMGATSTTFNDRLIYITIDELMPMIINRVVGEIRARLGDFFTSHGAYPPYAGLSVTPFNCSPTLPSGALPLVDGTESACTGLSLSSTTALPPWFLDNWMPVVTYTRMAPTQARLTINGQNYDILHN
jgi:hypothetical protein